MYPERKSYLMIKVREVKIVKEVKIAKEVKIVTQKKMN